MHTCPSVCVRRSTCEVGPCLMDVFALGLHYGARTGLY